jgi:predicted PurR-regulated permease PerM
MRDVEREELGMGEKEGGSRNREIRSFGGRVISERVAIFFLGVIAFIVVGAFLKSAQGVFIPFVVALLISYILAPPVRFLHKFGVPTSLIVVIMLGLLSGMVFLGIIYLNMSLVAFSKELPELQQKFFAMGKEISESSEAVRFLWRNLAEYFDVGSEMTARVLAFSRSFLSIATKMLLVVIFLVFLLVEAPYFEGKLRRALARRNAQKVQHIMETITVQIGHYLGLQCLISAATGLIAWGVLEYIGVKFALTWGVLTFLLNFIPTLGSVAATIPPILLAAVQFYPSYNEVLTTALALLILQQLMGNVLAPRVLGDRLNLSPALILFSLLFWGWLWGIPGGLLSIPITSAIKIVFENVRLVQGFAVLMGSGRHYARMDDDQ